MGKGRGRGDRGEKKKKKEDRSKRDGLPKPHRKLHIDGETWIYNLNGYGVRVRSPNDKEHYVNWEDALAYWGTFRPAALKDYILTVILGREIVPTKENDYSGLLSDKSDHQFWVDSRDGHYHKVKYFPTARDAVMVRYNVGNTRGLIFSSRRVSV